MTERNGHRRTAIAAAVISALLMFALGFLSNMIGAEMRFSKKEDLQRLEGKVDNLTAQMSLACAKLAVIETGMNDHDNHHLMTQNEDR